MVAGDRESQTFDFVSSSNASESEVFGIDSWVENLPRERSIGPGIRSWSVQLACCADDAGLEVVAAWWGDDCIGSRGCGIGGKRGRVVG